MDTMCFVRKQPVSFGQHVVAEVDLEQPVDRCLAHFPGKVVLSIHIVRVGDEALLNEHRISADAGEQVVRRETYLEPTHVLEGLFGAF